MPTTTISRPSHILLIFSYKPPRNPRPADIISFKCLMIIQDKKIRSSKNKILNFLIWKKKIFQLKFSSLMSLKMFTFFRAFLDSPGVKCHK